LSAGAGPSRLFLLLHNSWIVRRRKDHGSLWLSSRGLGCARDNSCGGDACWFGGLFWFICVQAGSLCATVLAFSVFRFWHRVLVGRVFGQVKVSALVVREMRGAFFNSVASLVGRLLLIRGREQFVTQVLLGCYGVSSNRLELEWWSKLTVWSKITIWCLIDQCWRCWFFAELLLGDSTFWGFLVFLFSLFGVILGIWSHYIYIYI